MVKDSRSRTPSLVRRPCTREGDAGVDDVLPFLLSVVIVVSLCNYVDILTLIDLLY